MFDIEKEITQLKEHKKIMRKKRYYSSKLDKYTDELKALRVHGARFSDLQQWLDLRGIIVCWSTIQRWFSKNG